jgi:predicted ArsR family transcriptional regulator
MEADVDKTNAIDHLGPTQRRLLQCLLQQPEGLSVERLATELGFTPGAVRQHLAALERDGLVQRAGQQPTKGRPERLYTLTPRGREGFPRRYRDLAESLLEEVGHTIGEKKLEDMMRRMGARAGADVRDASGKRATIEATAAAMQEAGYEAEVNPEQKDEIVAHNCVFHTLAEHFPAICQFDLAFMESATDTKVEHRECMVRGGGVCRFRFKRKK